MLASFFLISVHILGPLGTIAGQLVNMLLYGQPAYRVYLISGSFLEPVGLRFFIIGDHDYPLQGFEMVSDMTL